MRSSSEERLWEKRGVGPAFRVEGDEDEMLGTRTAEELAAPLSGVDTGRLIEARFGDRPAITWFGRHLSYRWLLAEVERFSAMLVDLGVRAGDRVAVILPNTPQYVIAYYASARIGAIAVGNNPLYTERVMEHQLRDTEPAVVVVLDEFHPAFASVFGSLGIDARCPWVTA
jgi:long-chain acyl-CoA synthetase